MVEVDRTVDFALRSIVDGRCTDGQALRYFRETPGEAEPACDGAVLWESVGGLSTCGIAYVTEWVGEENGPEPDRPPLAARVLTTGYERHIHPGRRYRIRQMASIVSSAMHAQPDLAAVGPPALAKKRGFETVRQANKAVWDDLWKGRIRLGGPPAALASDGRRGVFLFDELHARRRARLHLHLRSRDMARLPLLLRACDVGHRDIRGPGP